MAVDAQTRNGAAAEHLELLRSLARELERAMEAIACNRLGELEDSIATQQELSDRLTGLAHDRRAALLARTSPAAELTNDELGQQIHGAAGELEKLNLRYSILLEHSSRSVAQMASLFRSFQGQFQEDSGVRLKHQTLSCRG